MRIGRRVPDVLFDRLNARVAVILTAWNPMSRRMPDGWNHRMQAHLRRCLRRCVALEAAGSLKRWREAMLLVAGDPRPRVRLAARFRQRAVVMVRRGDRVRLRLVGNCGESRSIAKHYEWHQCMLRPAFGCGGSDGRQQARRRPATDNKTP
jgi:hypothetical protein